MAKNYYKLESSENLDAFSQFLKAVFLIGRWIIYFLDELLIISMLVIIYLWSDRLFSEIIVWYFKALVLNIQSNWLDTGLFLIFL